MSLKKRLIVTFLLLLILPLLVFFALAFISNKTLDENYFGVLPGGMLQLTVLQAVIMLVFIIIITDFVLVIWLYRSILRPLNLLTVATNKIKEGNLDFTLPTEPESTDELEQLCEDFEEMQRVSCNSGQNMIK